MSNSTDRSQPAADAPEPLHQFLANLAKQGISQAKVASRAGLPQQFLSDVKNARRPLTELTARRLGEEFGVDFKWLLGEKQSPRRPQLLGTSAVGRMVVLPVFDAPVAGEPTQSPTWNGSGAAIVGAAVARLEGAERPYLLRFGQDDVEKRLRRGDLVLISQARNEDADVCVLEYRGKLFLARRDRRGAWRRVAEGKEFPRDSEVRGHCLGIVWSPLC
jgi:hypothetical protein